MAKGKTVYWFDAGKVKIERRPGMGWCVLSLQPYPTLWVLEGFNLSKSKAWEMAEGLTDGP